MLLHSSFAVRDPSSRARFTARSGNRSTESLNVGTQRPSYFPIIIWHYCVVSVLLLLLFVYRKREKGKKPGGATSDGHAHEMHEISPKNHSRVRRVYVRVQHARHLHGTAGRVRFPRPPRVCSPLFRRFLFIFIIFSSSSVPSVRRAINNHKRSKHTRKRIRRPVPENPLSPVHQTICRFRI